MTQELKRLLGELAALKMQIDDLPVGSDLQAARRYYLQRSATDMLRFVEEWQKDHGVGVKQSA